MDAYVYCWSLRPEEGVALELRVTAPNVVVARRAIDRFLVHHADGAWTVESIHRETQQAAISLLPRSAGSPIQAS